MLGCAQYISRFVILLICISCALKYAPALVLLRIQESYTGPTKCIQGFVVQLYYAPYYEITGIPVIATSIFMFAIYHPRSTIRCLRVVHPPGVVPFLKKRHELNYTRHYTANYVLKYNHSCYVCYRCIYFVSVTPLRDYVSTITHIIITLRTRKSVLRVHVVTYIPVFWLYIF